MSDKIDEIRDRHSRRSEIDQSGCYRLDGFTYMGSLSQSQEDVATLLAEVDRQRAEIERLTRERDEARYFLKIFVHAHASNNAVPPHLEEQARKALESKP